MAKIQDFLKEARSVCITGHVRPDGDCVGSTLGLYTYLRNQFPQIRTDLYLEEPTEKLAFLPGFSEIITTYPDAEPYDVMFCLDSGSLERIGKAAKYFRQAKRTVNIDHHVSNTLFADDNFVDGSSSSASEEIYKFLDPSLLSREIAICLYTGIIYDTGVFKYRSTSPLTMQIAAELMKFDIPTDLVIDESFYAKTYAENRIFGYAILNSRLAFDGKVIYSTLSGAELKEFGVSSKELEGIVAQLRLTRGAGVAFFLYETPAGDVKVSFRSQDPYDVNQVAQQFGGGGHVRASGAMMKGSLEECTARILKALEGTF